MTKAFKFHIICIDKNTIVSCIRFRQNIVHELFFVQLYVLHLIHNKRTYHSNKFLGPSLWRYIGGVFISDIF